MYCHAFVVSSREPLNYKPDAMQRLTLLFIPVLIAIALFSGISVFDNIGTQPESPAATEALNYSAYSEGISTILYDDKGAINYTLQATSQIHYNDNVTELEHPHIRLFQDGNSRWNIIANSGRISATEGDGGTSIQRIDLTGNVELTSLDNFDDRMLMSTEFLSLDPQLKTLKTDKAVTIVTNTLQQSSIGLTGDLKIDEFIFLREIRGQHAKPVN